MMAALHLVTDSLTQRHKNTNTKSKSIKLMNKLNEANFYFKGKFGGTQKLVCFELVEKYARILHM